MHGPARSSWTCTESRNNTRYLNRIRSADFFDVERHPESRMTITDVRASQKGCTRRLMILNVTNEIVFPASASREGSSVRVNADFGIDRTRRGIIFD